MKHRLYLPPPITADRVLKLDRERAHYLTRVLRLRQGQDIECFDGTGRAWSATLASATSRTVTLRVGGLLAEAPEPTPRVHLVQALLKGASMDLVFQKATELGATDLWPIVAERSNVPRDRGRLERKREHWQRVTESAAEQCGALHLPRLHDVCGLTTFLGGTRDFDLILLDPGAPPLPLDLPQRATAILVGPEGGWTDAERAMATAAGAIRYGLGTRVMRGETVPLVALAALRHGWRWD